MLLVICGNCACHLHYWFIMGEEGGAACTSLYRSLAATLALAAAAASTSSAAATGTSSGTGIESPLGNHNGNATATDMTSIVQQRLWPNSSGSSVNANVSDMDIYTDPKEWIESIVRENEKNMHRFPPETQIALIVAFATLIIFGACGNGLVCYVVARNPHMRTPRNIFIINLAISDLTLCLFTQPSNLMKVLRKDWVLGEFMCKLVPMFAGTNVFVSTISITAIALDRFQVIVYPTKDSMRTVGAAVALISIWIISFLMASPMLIFNILHGYEPLPGLVIFTVCIENHDLSYEKGAYSIACMIFQYIVPIFIVSVAHARICNKLKYRMINQQSPASTTVNSPYLQRKSEREQRRQRRTNTLLIGIGIVFALSWLPLNSMNIIADFNLDLYRQFDPDGLIFALGHLCVLCSACCNPVLYGWLNENFKKEFLQVLCCNCCKNFRMVCQRRDRCRENSAMETSVVVYKKTATNGSAVPGGCDADDSPQLPKHIPPDNGTLITHVVNETSPKHDSSH